MLKIYEFNSDTGFCSSAKVLKFGRHQQEISPPHIWLFINLSNSNQELLDKGTPTCSLKFYHTAVCISVFDINYYNSVKWYDCVVFREDWSAELQMFDEKLWSIM